MNETYHIVKLGRYFLYENFEDPEFTLISNIHSATHYSEEDAKTNAADTNGQVIKVTYEEVFNPSIIKTVLCEQDVLNESLKEE